MALPGYGRDEYEDLDEYEDDVEEQEEEAGEEGYEDEEAHQPTQEELEYLELRQRLKEAYRKQMKKEPGSARSNSRDSKRPFDNFGSFFGPSQPVIAQRVIQESKSLLENPHLAARMSNGHRNNINKSSSMTSTSGGSKSQSSGQPAKGTNKLKTKVQMIKNTRDYSFLLSDDAELPVRTKDPPTRNVSVQNSEARLAQVLSKRKQSLGNPSARVPNGPEERKPLPPGGKMQPKMVAHNMPSRSKPNSMPVDSGRQIKRGHGSGPGQTVVPKGLSSPVATKEKKNSIPVTKKSTSSINKPTSTKFQPSIAKKPLQQKKEYKDLGNGKTMPKPSVPSCKPQLKQSTAKVSAHAAVKENRPKKRPMKQYTDDEGDGGDISMMIRQMFGYNPNKYKDKDVDDDSDMEANFDDIMREVKKSARVGKMEDEEELRKMEEEERRERMRREAKRRRLSQR